MVTLTERQYESLYYALLTIAAGRNTLGGNFSRRQLIDIARNALMKAGEPEGWSPNRLYAEAHSIAREINDDTRNRVGRSHGPAKQSGAV